MNATERDDNLPGFLDVGCEAVRNDDEPHYLSILLLFYLYANDICSYLFSVANHPNTDP